ncbi:MAG: BadF/BadG/BcrA/BcrD ATPase family protein [Planctomycetaceae bacterium]|nr:hypothetical protein [Planctomycetaceae bacterium]
MSNFFIGIDGGASKTAGVAVDEQGQVLAAEKTEGSAIFAEPAPQPLRVLKGLVKSLRTAAGVKSEDLTIGLGLNGVDFDDEIPMQHAAIAEALGVDKSRLILVNDGIVALWGASSARGAALWQHGSSFTSAYRSDYGHETLFDSLDVGKCYDIRVQTVALVARMIDGRAKPSALRDTILQHLGLTPRQYAAAVWRRHADATRMFTLAKVVFDAFEAGEPSAAKLVAAAIDDYAIAASAMIAQTGRNDAEVAFGGGVIAQAGATFWQRLTQRVHQHKPAASVIRAQLPPECGAAVMAAFAAGIDPKAFFMHLLQSWKDASAQV